MPLVSRSARFSCVRAPAQRASCPSLFLRAAALGLLGGSLTELGNLHAGMKDGALTVAVWKKMWEAHAKVAQKVLASMEKTLAEYPDAEKECETLRAQFQPVLMQVSEALEAAKTAVLAPGAVTLKRKRGGGDVLGGALKVLKAHRYDFTAASAQKGNKYLSIPQLRALATHKQVEGCEKLLKKDALIARIVEADAFASERAAL